MLSYFRDRENELDLLIAHWCAQGRPTEGAFGLAMASLRAGIEAPSARRMLRVFFDGDFRGYGLAKLRRDAQQLFRELGRKPLSMHQASSVLASSERSAPGSAAAVAALYNS